MREPRDQTGPLNRAPPQSDAAVGHWDGLERELAERAAGLDGPAVMCAIELVEERALHDVLAIVEDAQFPADLRERVTSAVSRWRIGAGSAEARAHARRTGRSKLVEELRLVFTELADREVEVRWGLFSEDPAAMQRERERHDRGPGTGDGYNL